MGMLRCHRHRNRSGPKEVTRTASAPKQSRWHRHCTALLATEDDKDVSADPMRNSITWDLGMAIFYTHTTAMNMKLESIHTTIPGTQVAKGTLFLAMLRKLCSHSRSDV